MNKDRLQELIYKFHFRILTSDEKKEFEHMLKESSDARKKFHEWNTVNQAFDAMSIHKERLIIPVEEAQVTKRRSTFRAKIINMVAMLAIPLLAAAIYLYIDKQDDILVTYNEVSCTHAKVVTIKLSDGSTVYLYSGSTLKYPSQFIDNVRSVNLVGEATFEVESAPETPFFVETVDGSKIKAYGTKFNVCSYEQDSVTSIYLEHGAIDFESDLLDKPVPVKPDYRIDYMRKTNRYSISEDKADKYNARENGILLFQKTPLKEIVVKLSRVHDIDIEIEDEAIGNYPFTASFDDESIYQILSMLKKSSPDLQWRKVENENKIIITKN